MFKFLKKKKCYKTNVLSINESNIYLKDMINKRAIELNKKKKKEINQLIVEKNKLLQVNKILESNMNVLRATIDEIEKICNNHKKSNIAKEILQKIK